MYLRAVVVDHPRPGVGAPDLQGAEGAHGLGGLEDVHVLQRGLAHGAGGVRVFVGTGKMDVRRNGVPALCPSLFKPAQWI